MRITAVVIIGFAVGVLSGLLGIGGGTILVPAMVYLLGMNQHRAHGTSLAVISLIVLIAAIFYSRQGQMDWAIAIEMAVGGVVGAAVGARIACLLSGSRLRRYFGLLLAAIGIRMLYDAAAAIAGFNGHVHAGQMISPHILDGGLLIIGVGVIAGILSGLLGVGGGIIMIPAMVLLLGLDQKMAQGISLAVIIPVSISGALIHGAHGNVKFDIALWLVVGGVIGGLVGAYIAIGSNSMVLRGLFSILMLVMGVLMLVRKSRQGQAEAELPNEEGMGLGG